MNFSSRIELEVKSRLDLIQVPFSCERSISIPAAKMYIVANVVPMYRLWEFSDVF